MQLVVPDPHPGCVLAAMAFAQAQPAQRVVLVDAVMRGLIVQSATPLQVADWEWLGRQGGVMGLSWVKQTRRRKELEALRQIGVREVLRVPFSVADAVAQDKETKEAELIAGALQVPMAGPVVCDGRVLEPFDMAPHLSAHADALARVAALFRSVPDSRQGCFRFIWVLDHAEAMRLVCDHEDAFRAVLLALSALAIHLHIVRVVPDAMSSLLLGRDPVLQRWQAILNVSAPADAGAVVDLGVVRELSGAAVLTGLLAHADVVLTDIAWVNGLAKGLGKLESGTGVRPLLCGGDNQAASAGCAAVGLESSFLSVVCDRFPFVVKR